MKQFFSSLLEVFEVIAVEFGAVFLIRSFLVQPFLVSGSSMVPNFSDGDYLLVDEVTYRFRQPERGEVVVFKYPKEESVYFIKRVIGLPGERVRIGDGKITVVNAAHPEGVTLDERYLPNGLTTAGSTEFNVPAGSYFVLGDNRPSSFDSRNWGMLSAKEVVGVVDFRLWPPNALKVFAAPSY